MKTSNQIIDEIISNIRANGHLDYGESVTILEHGVQSAVFAERDGADDLMIAAAFLHDYGHFVHDFGEDIADQGIDAVHEEIGANFFARLLYPRSDRTRTAACGSQALSSSN